MPELFFFRLIRMQKLYTSIAEYIILLVIKIKDLSIRISNNIALL